MSSSLEEQSCIYEALLVHFKENAILRTQKLAAKFYQAFHRFGYFLQGIWNAAIAKICLVSTVTWEWLQ